MKDPEIDKKSYLMIREYGKERAAKVAKDYADDIVREINAMPFYDGDRVSALQDKHIHWLTVENTIKNWQ